MKKFAVIFFVAFVATVAVSSCNQKVCPAYSKAAVEQAGQHI
jgi:hypothetical protein